MCNVEGKWLAELLAAYEPDLLQNSDIVSGKWLPAFRRNIFAIEMCFESGRSRFLLNAGNYILEYQALHRL